jgi:hypothetical protein
MSNNATWKWSTGLNEFDLLLRSSGDGQYIRPAVDALLSSLIINSYTTFETFAEDLWEIALNIHPEQLSSLKGKSKRTGGKEDRSSSGGPKLDEQEKSIQLRLLQKYRYNLRNVMGTILKAKQRFDRFEGIREAYEAAFDTDREEIDQVFKHEGLRELSVLRNNLIHSAGIVEQELLDSHKSSRIKKEYTLIVDSPLPIDAPLAATAMHSTMECCIALARAVDNWLVTHIA